MAGHCLATCQDNHEEPQGIATRDNDQYKLETLLTGSTPEVREVAIMVLDNGNLGGQH